jgi:hypothetical protein
MQGRAAERINGMKHFFTHKKYVTLIGWFGIFCYLSILHPLADTLRFKDGTVLRCQVLAETQSQESGMRYIQIQIDRSLVWVNRELIERIDKSPETIPQSSNIQDLLKRLTHEGKVVMDLQEQLDFVSPPTSVETEIPFVVKNINGWAYLYKDQQAIDNRQRTPLQEGEPIPSGYFLILSPNSHVTLTIGDVGEIGLESSTQLRFEDILFNRSIQSYEMNLNLYRGKCWININTPPTSWKRVLFSINKARCVLETATLYAQSSTRAGEVDITYLDGKSSLNFYRGNDGPFLVPVGQTLQVKSNTSKLPIVKTDNLETLQSKITNWTSWKPEELLVDLHQVIPPITTFPSFNVLPALHPHQIPIDQSMMFPPETRSLGEIMKIYRAAFDQYKYDTGKFPSPQHGLKALYSPFNMNGWRGPYVSLDVPQKDLWGEDFIYELYTYRGREYPDIRSKGPNKKDDRGLGDDIR